MGFLNSQVDAAFKEDFEGRIVFFPFGIFGDGYVVPNEARRDRLREHLLWRTRLSFLLCLVAGGIFSRSSSTWPLAGLELLLVLPPLFFSDRVWVRKITEGLDVYDKHLARLLYAYNTSNRRILISLISWLIGAMFGVFIIYKGEIWLGLFILVMSIYCAFLWLQITRSKAQVD